MRYFIIIFSVLFFSCEEVVTLDSPKSNHYLVVESTLTNLPGPQKIFLTQSQDYFDNSAAPAVQGAEVVVIDDASNSFRFVESIENPGVYVWSPSATNQQFGVVGSTYQLTVKTLTDTYLASAKMNPVPPVDSITYKASQASLRQINDGQPKEGFVARFFGNDLKGEGSCYRMKFYKNDTLFNAPSNLVVIYDSALQKVPGTDGLMFNLPIRASINPKLYVANDKVKVELYSISLDQYSFYSQARLELNNAGLFSRPAANIPTNIRNLNASSKLQGAGWFGVSAVSMLETSIDPAKAKKELP
ncbi:MAG: DUF4249 domain-containing protein [Bacteroidota bacterium]